MFLLNYNSPRWLIFVIDNLICLCSILLAYLLRFNFDIPEKDISKLYYIIPFILTVRSLSFIIGRTYAGIIRYTSTIDAQRIFITLFLGSIFFLISNVISFYNSHTYIIPISIIIIDFMAAFFIMMSSRVLVKVLYLELTNPTRKKGNVAILGAGERAIITQRTITKDSNSSLNVIALFNDNPKIFNKKIGGVPIIDIAKFREKIPELDLESLIISKENIPSDLKTEIVEVCLENNVKILDVPPVEKWINGELSFNQIKRVKIEKLLEREPIQLDNKTIAEYINTKTVLITGAAGSIGSELVRQVMHFSPKKIVLVDQAESPMYDLENEIIETCNKMQSVDIGFNFDYKVILADIRKKRRMRYIFETYKPDVVLHAAAYKHVPLMENNPLESVLVNVMGSKILADLAKEFSVKKFVMISTDKAVNPTNVMGATKRVAEMYIQSLNNVSDTQFITTRFGNVLGSNGSVIPIFRKQIEKGGPVTVTHPEITRFFMTIPEACQLVLQAGAVGKGGEIFIFDMGKSVKIVDLAKKMIMLSGLVLDKDIKIKYTGVRPGEKLYEELLNNEENVLPTVHPKIMIAKVHELDFEVVSKQVTDLVDLFDYQDNMKVVEKLKEVVPEFKSKNSVFEKLDIK